MYLERIRPPYCGSSRRCTGREMASSLCHAQTRWYSTSGHSQLGHCSHESASPLCGSLRRSDLSIMCSPVEVEMLKLYYGLTPSNVALSSFLCSAAPLAEIPGYAERQHFMTIGERTPSPCAWGSK